VPKPSVGQHRCHGGYGVTAYINFIFHGFTLMCTKKIDREGSTAFFLLHRISPPSLFIP
jgi:hypothetical protein